MSGANDLGLRMHQLMRRLWPICRSITGEGVRQTLSIISEYIPDIKIHEIPTGAQCFDWQVPKEWSIKDAFIKDENGNKIISFAENNLHVVNYSTPIDKVISLNELLPHLHSLPEQPTAIPYVTSYYKESWGFCLPDQLKENLQPGNYHVFIDSEHKEGSLIYADLIIEGKTDREILISTYVCHPSMANNELSGPCVSTMLAEWLLQQDLYYTYRIVYVPETIGAICYLSKHLEKLKKKVVAGYVVTCVGDERAWSFMPSRDGNSYSDHLARHVLDASGINYQEYSFLERGSDERQYCSPGIDLPVASIMRSKYATYPEYHTSLDDMEFVTAVGLEEALNVYINVIKAIEIDCYPVSQVLGEPMMSKRGLRATTGKVGSAADSIDLMNVLAYADGSKSLLDIAKLIGKPVWELAPVLDSLVECELIKKNIRH